MADLREVNLGYNVFAPWRGNGYATRAVKLLLHHLSISGSATVATLLIHPDNASSLALAERAGFVRHGELDGNPYWKLCVAPLSYSDGVVTIRRREPADLEPDLEAKDEEQLRWLWLPWQRDAWAGMSDEERRAHALRVLAGDHESFGRGPSGASRRWPRPRSDGLERLGAANRRQPREATPMEQDPFDAPITLAGPEREPRQMLAEQTYGGHASLHDDATAGSLGLSGAPIEGPTHFSQFDPLAHVLWGSAWFERGCISAHFQTMVVEGEGVTARAVHRGGARADISATKRDGSPVLSGSISLGPDVPTALDERRAKLGGPGELFIVDQLSVGDRSGPVTTSVGLSTPNGDLYPFSLEQKLDAITEPSDWYRSEDNPWGRPVLPMEMISVLAQKPGTDFPVRGPSVGLFLDLEIELVAGPVFVGHDYVLEREVVGLGQSRRTESSWVRTDVTDAGTGDLVAHVLLHSGVFKESYARYPADRL